MDYPYGKFTNTDGAWKPHERLLGETISNNLTRRNREMVEFTPARAPSTSLASANLKVLRCYRSILRVLPFIIRIMDFKHRTNAIQSAQFVGNHFRRNATMTDLDQIDKRVDYAYEVLMEAEWHMTHPSYLVHLLWSQKIHIHDKGKDRFDDYLGSKRNKQASSFMKGFYTGHKSPEI